MAATSARISHISPRVEALVGSDWAAETREMSLAALERLNTELTTEYLAKHSAFCRSAPVLSALERPEALGYATGSPLSCQKLVDDLDLLDPHDPMPGTRARTALFRTLEYLSLRTSVHRAAFAARVLRSHYFDAAIQPCLPPHAANIAAQAIALRAFTPVLADACRAEERSRAASCRRSMTATTSYLASVDQAVETACATTESDDVSRSGSRAAGAQDER